MRTYDEHVAELSELLTPRAAMPVGTRDALGLVLAADVRARGDLPTFASSAMDGYAVRVADVPGILSVVAEVAAGQVPRVSVTGGCAVQVMTGSMLPAGTEAVIPVEDTERVGDSVRITAATRPGAFLRGAGDDLAAGALVVGAGQRLGPAQIAAILAAGVLTVQARPQLRVGVLSTGDELVRAGETPGPAQLVDSNGPGLVAAATAAGVQVVDAGLVGDDSVALLAALDAVAPAVDLILTSGGVSMGAHDVVKAALAGAGIRFDQVAVQPGRPQGWGHYAGGPGFIGLPGNPVSALVCFEIFVRPALGCPRPLLNSHLVADVPSSPAGRRQFLRGVYAAGGVRPEGGAASHLLAGMARAECLIVIAEETVALAAGSPVAVMPLTP